jgi:hypothetical protein
MKVKGSLAFLALLAVCVCALGWTAYGQRRERDTERRVWEYKRVDLDYGEAALNKLGADGWELVAIEPSTDPSYPKRAYYVLKRAR